jgi:hypothetical protein
LAFTGLFNLIETRFYNPSITNSLTREVRQDAETIQRFFDQLEGLFAASLQDEAVKRSFLPDQTAEDIYNRTRLFGTLMETQRGLQSVRFVDAGGLRIHFSTSAADVQSRASESLTYKNYNEAVPFVPYAELAVPSGGEPRIIPDQVNERIVFSFPFYDSMEVYRGTAFYALAVRAVTEQLVAEGRVRIGEDLAATAVPPGLVLGLPYAGREVILPVIASVWEEGLLGPHALRSRSSDSTLVLLSAKTERGLIAGRVVEEALFILPPAMKIILLAAIFLTVYLSVFMILNLRADTMTVVQNRIKQLKLSLIREYYEHRQDTDWNHWYRKLEQRREDVRVELKRGIGKKTPALLEDIDALIDTSWDEILAAVGGRREPLVIDEDRLQSIVSRMLAGVQGAGSAVLEQPEGETVEEVEVLEDAEPEEAEPVSLEENGELEELEELEDDTEGPQNVSPPPSGIFGTRTGPSQEDLASQIEFSVSPEEDAPGPDPELEIVSPFEEIRAHFSGMESSGDTKNSGYLEELDGGYAVSLVYRPFQNETRQEPEMLDGPDPEVIKRRNGVSYVDKKAADTPKSLDPGLKTLVDSVIGQK